MNILITICARGGSKGIPGKNIKPLCEKPLIAYSIDAARKFAAIYKADIALSTDDAKIKEVALQFGLATDYLRPLKLADDNAGKVDAITHLLIYEEQKHNIRYDLILDLDVSAPIRSIDDLVAAHKLITANAEAYNLFSVSPARRNPYFNMVEQGSDGFYKIVKEFNKDLITRQKSPVVYDLNASFYFYKRAFFDLNFKSVMTDKTLAYLVPHICFDIDEPLDFDIMEYLMSSKKLGFEL